MDYENSTEAIVDVLNGIRIEAKRIADALEAQTLPPKKPYELNVVVPTPLRTRNHPAYADETEEEKETPTEEK